MIKKIESLKKTFNHYKIKKNLLGCGQIFLSFTLILQNFV